MCQKWYRRVVLIPHHNIQCLNTSDHTLLILIKYNKLPARKLSLSFFLGLRTDWEWYVSRFSAVHHQTTREMNSVFGLQMKIGPLQPNSVAKERNTFGITCRRGQGMQRWYSMISRSIAIIPTQWPVKLAISRHVRITSNGTKKWRSEKEWSETNDTNNGYSFRKYIQLQNDTGAISCSCYGNRRVLPTHPSTTFYYTES